MRDYMNAAVKFVRGLLVYCLNEGVDSLPVMHAFQTGFRGYRFAEDSTILSAQKQAALDYLAGAGKPITEAELYSIQLKPAHAR